MTATTFTLLDDGHTRAVDARVENDRVLLSRAAVRLALGEAAGVAGGPLGSADEVDLADLARRLGRPLALDAAERTAWLGVSAADRGHALASLQAPDFALPDLGGRLHRLADHRGRKVLLVVWASW